MAFAPLCTHPKSQGSFPQGWCLEQDKEHNRYPWVPIIVNPFSSSYKKVFPTHSYEKRRPLLVLGFLGIKMVKKIDIAVKARGLLNGFLQILFPFMLV